MSQNPHANSIQLKVLLDKQVAERNTITSTEFKKFLPLFKKDGITDPDAAKDMATAWGDRVSLYDKVVVISEHAGKDNPVKLFELPAVFSRVSTLNKAGAAATQLSAAFFKALDQDNPLSIEPERNLLLINATLNSLIDKEKVISEVVEFAKIVRDLKADHSSPAETKVQKHSAFTLDDFE